MNTDSVLIAIDRALGDTATCRCNRELFPIERAGSLYLECPTFSAGSWLPARVAAFLDGAFHDQYVVDRLPAAPVRKPANVIAGPLAA